MPLTWPAAAVAAGKVFHLHQRKVVHAALPQRARGGQACHATASDQGMDAAGDGRRLGQEPGPRSAHKVAALVADADKPAGHFMLPLAAQHRQRCPRKHGAARDHSCTLPHSRS
jgi:hypothetical protein